MCRSARPLRSKPLSYCAVWLAAPFRRLLVVVRMVPAARRAAAVSSAQIGLLPVTGAWVTSPSWVGAVTGAGSTMTGVMVGAGGSAATTVVVVAGPVVVVDVPGTVGGTVVGSVGGTVGGTVVDVVEVVDVVDVVDVVVVGVTVGV